MGADDRLDEIIAAWRENRDRGDHVDPESVVRAHPELADRLRARFAALAALDEMFAESRALAAPAPDRIGPYTIERELGAGGMGRVYLARRGDDRVALKVLHPHLLARPGFLERFQREADAGRHVAHENVVRTLESGVASADGAHLHYLAMEYVEGRTLRQLQRDLRRVPEALLREIAAQVCAGVAAIHAAGLVHRDLKPENIILTGDERARVMDLGVAHQSDLSDALTRTGEFAGSLKYAAPEQFSSEPIDGRLDLYALGVLLYELATGSNPFDWDDPARIVSAHSSFTPRPANELEQDVSPFLGAVLAVLLEKAPDNRFRSAAEVEAVLRQGEDSPWWAERRRSAIAATRRPDLGIRRDTALHGRDTPLETLRELLARTHTGRGHTVLIEGEAGIGKTRLVDAFLEEAAREDATLLYGSYPPSGGRDAVAAALLDHLGPGPIEEAVAPLLEETPGLLPGFCAWVRGEPAPEGGELQPEVLAMALARVGQALASQRPVVWVVDDLHFASADSLQAVLSLAPALAESRVLLIGATRPGLPDAVPAELGRLQRFTRIEIDRLSPRQVVELLREAFRSEALAEALGGKLAYKSDGVPFFIFEIVRGLQDGQFIEQDADGTWTTSQVIREIEIPSSVWDLIQARMGGLSHGERDLMEVAACCGFEFDPVLVGRVLGLGRIPALQSFGRIERIHGVLRPAGRRLRFDHHLVQEALYDGMLVALREGYHAAIAESMAEVHGLDTAPATGVLAVEVCRHFLLGLQGARARPHLDEALSHLEATHQRADAAELARLALDAPALLEGAERFDMLLRRAKHLRRLGRTDEDLAALEEARAIAASPAQAARVRTAMGSHFEATGEPQEALRQYEGAREELRRAGERHREAQLEGRVGSCLQALGRYGEAYGRQQRSLELARAHGDEESEIRALASLGVIAEARGRHDESRSRYEASIALAGGSRPRLRLAPLVNLGVLCAAQGLAKEAMAYYQEAVECAREQGSRLAEATGVGNLGCLLIAQGRLASAREHVQRWQVLSREISDRAGDCFASVNLGSIETYLGNDEMAETQLRYALDLARDLGLSGVEGSVLSATGLLAAQAGDDERAERLFREALDLYDELGVKDPAALMAQCLLARTRIRRGGGEEVADLLRDVVAGARDLNMPIVRALGLAELALLGRARPEDVIDVLEAAGDRVDHWTRMETTFLLWRATGDARHLADAHRMLTFQLDNAPPECREAMVARVGLYNEIAAAWRGAKETQH